MPLTLRRAADQFPRARWEPSNEHPVIMSGEAVVGSLKRQTGGTAGDRWFWSITCVLIDPEESQRIGRARTREEAQQQFAEARRAWLARTRLQEAWRDHRAPIVAEAKRATLEFPVSDRHK